MSDVSRSKNEENEAYLSEIEVGFLFLKERSSFHMTIFSNYSACEICPFFTMLIFAYLWIFSLQTIGQAYDDMQTQNQHLLHQITERDDYNIKVFILN